MPPLRADMRPVGALALALALVACGAGEPSDGTSGPSESAGDRPASIADEGTEWTSRSSESGTLVRLVPPSVSLRPGVLRFRIEASRPDVPEPSSVDLVSPDMPMHGISRFPVQPVESGEFVAEIEVPMAGGWSLYVNLGDGSDAAEFDIVVEGDETRPGTADPVHHEPDGVRT